jgi:ABC-type glycerol-3-phosphate transport system substrate-binding protein
MPRLTPPSTPRAARDDRHPMRARALRVATALALFAALGACGGGSSPTPTPTPTPVATVLTWDSGDWDSLNWN